MSVFALSSIRKKSGFTMIEILVVIAITVILLGLIMYPVIRTFNLTRQANVMVMAQDTARNTLEQITRELGQAMFVYDNSNSPINFPVTDPKGNNVVLQALYGKIDFVLPKMFMHCNNPDHDESKGSRDYERGDEAFPPCPVCGSTNVEARPKEPLSQDTKIVRYFVGLKDPTKPRDWVDEGAPENGFVLYRAEFDPYDTDLVDRDNQTGEPILDDPNFFYGPHRDAWRKISHVVGPIKDVDDVIITLDDAGDHIRAVAPSIRFQLTSVTNDSFEPAYISDLAAETPNAVPTVFRSSYGGWGSSIGSANPEMFVISVIRYNKATGANDIWYRTGWSNGHLMLYKYVGNSFTPIFDITQYMTSGTFSNPTPELAFTVDPVRGEVRFDFPDSDTISVDDIRAMNQNVAANWSSKTNPPERKYQITRFQGISANSLYRPRIVPGSEVVIGPDMTPGLRPDQIRMVRYERVPLALGNPGRNQYKIDYGFNDPTGENTGVITFSPAYDEAIPETIAGGQDARIEISYKYQLNQDGDIVIGNYLTKTLLNVTVGIRIFDQDSGRLCAVEVSNKVRIRNLMR
jgi:prepilin-type N-terminal cleavage/methylation domain-containing protein